MSKLEIIEPNESDLDIEFSNLILDIRTALVDTWASDCSDKFIGAMLGHNRVWLNRRINGHAQATRKDIFAARYLKHCLCINESQRLAHKFFIEGPKLIFMREEKE